MLRNGNNELSCTDIAAYLETHYKQTYETFNTVGNYLASLHHEGRSHKKGQDYQQMIWDFDRIFDRDLSDIDLENVYERIWALLQLPQAGMW